MSGLGGVVRLDGAPVTAAAVEGLAGAVAHRGPDGQGAWSEGHVALVHAMLHTTPESLVEPQPVVDGELVVVADAWGGASGFLGVPRGSSGEVAFASPRNSEELRGTRGTPGDAARIAAAYRRWGAECVHHLDGDFAFAVWDRRERTLFCARDAFGVKPLVYAHLPGKLFAFGSVARVPLALAEVPRDLDEKRIADFLSVHFDDTERTFYRALRRLPGGCTLTLRDGQVAVRRYWSPEAVRPLPRQSDAAYAEEFLEHFTRAVHDRMRVSRPGELGSMLSGGLDSSFISCVARNASAEPLPVFSWIFSDAMEADEREYQEAVLATGGFRPVTLDSQHLNASPWTDLDALLPDGPPYSPNHYLNSIAGRAGREIGVRVLLDGLGGDGTISRGPARFTELFFQGRLFTLTRELRALAAVRGEQKSLSRLFAANVAAPLMPAALLHFALRLRGRAPSEDPGRKLLHPRIAKLSGASERRKRVAITTRQDHLQQFRAPLLAEGLELFDRVMAAAGVEGRYPFFDRQLAEYCLSLPGDQKLAGGYNRIVARRAMDGIVPDVVQWRAGKGAPGLHILHALRANRSRLDALFLRDPSALAPYVDVDRLRDTYALLFSDRGIDFHTAVRLWSAAVLGQWLARH